jgi:hypothetical protein
MSFDPNPQNQPMGTVQPKKSGMKWWVIGCFTLLLLCGGGAAMIGIPIYRAGMAMVETIDDAKNTIENSAEAQEILGAPLTVGDPGQVTSSQNGADASMSMTFPVTGSNKSGEVEVEMSGNPITTGMKIDKLELNVDGEVYPLQSLDALIE